VADLDEILFAEQERQRQEFERMRQQDRRRQARNGPIENAIKQEAKQAGKKAVKRVIVTAVLPVLWSAFLAALPFILIGLLIAFVIVAAIYMVCNPEGLIALGISYGLEFSGMIPEGVCDAFSAFSGVATVITKGQELMCTNPQILAEQSRVTYPVRNDPDLDRLVSCIQADVPNAGSVFTADESNEICNYTRGAETCGQCSHSVNSCHYGGTNGAGSMAVDFGGGPGAGNEGLIGTQVLQAALSCSETLGIPLKRSTCENSSATAVQCSDTSANHIHISLGKCDRDNGPINSQ